MHRILFLLLLPISFSSFAQITLGDQFQFSPEYNLRDRVPNNKNETSVIYHNGKTFCFTARPWDAKNHEYGAVLVYDEKDKWFPAAIDAHKWRNNADNHPTTVGVVMGNGKILLGGELDHGQDFEFWTSNVWPQNYTYKATQTLNLARGSMYPYKSNSAKVILQEAGINLVETHWIDSLETMSSPRYFIKPVQTGKRIYWSRPRGKDYLPGGWYVGIPQISTSQGHEEYGVMKTKDFVTFYNWHGTDSVNTTVPTNENIIRKSGWKFFGRKNAVPSLANCIQAISDDNKFYSLAVDEADSSFQIITANDTGFVSRVTYLPNGKIPLPLAAGIPDGGCLHWMYVKGGVIYATILVQDSLYRKIRLYSINAESGTVLTDHGDLLPSVNDNIHKCSGPENYIPGDGKKWCFYLCKQVYQGSGGSGYPGTVYAVEAWFGSVPVPDSIETIPPPTPIESENWKFRYDAVGNPGGGLKDDSGHGNDAVGTYTTSGNWIYSTTGFTLPNIFEDDQEGTLIIKTIRQSVASKLYAWGTTTNAYKYMEIELTDKVTWRLSQTSSVTGQGRISSTKLISVGDTVTIAIVGNKYHLRFWVNGVETNKNWETDSSPQKTWRWIQYLKASLAAPANTAMIGGRKNISTIATPIRFSFVGYIPYAINPEAISKQLME